MPHRPSRTQEHAITARPRFGIILPNRDVALGLTTADALIELTEYAEDSGAFEHVWVGDSIMAKPRLESLTLLAAMAARTSRVKLGVSCMASMPSRNPLVFGYQWASLDQISNGRMILQACMGDTSSDAGPQAEYANMAIAPAERGARLEENIEVVRRLWSEPEVDFHGKFHSFEGAFIEPKPIQNPPPIWVASRPRVKSAQSKDTERSLRRVAQLGDGWVTTAKSVEDFAWFWSALDGYATEYGRDFNTLPRCHCYGIAIGSDRESSLAETKAYLDRYYNRNHPVDYVEGSHALGSPEQCYEAIAGYVDAGATDMLLRFTLSDTRAQMRRFIDEVLPLFD